MSSACSKTCRSIAARAGANRLSLWRAIWRADPLCAVLPAGGGDHAGEAKKFLRILRLVIDENFVMHMRAGASSRTAGEPDLLVISNGLAHRHDVAVQMAVYGGDPIAVADFDNLAIIGSVTGIGHHPWRRRIYRCHVGRR